MGNNKNEIKKFRKELNKRGFFEDIILDKATLIMYASDAGISGWMYYLNKYKKIEVKKFKDLFSQVDNIVFPITITKMFDEEDNVRFEFCDYLGNTYYFICDYYYLNFKQILQYIIIKEDSSPETQEWCCQMRINRGLVNYKTITDKDIELLKTSIRKSNKEGFNTNIVVEFNYNCYETAATKVIRKSGDKEIILEYPSEGPEFDKKVKDILFNINEGINRKKWIYNNVKPLLKEMLKIMEKDDISIYIGAKLNNEVYAEVTVRNNTVKRHTYTKVVSEERIIITTDIFSKKLDEFLN